MSRPHHKAHAKTKTKTNGNGNGAASASASASERTRLLLPTSATSRPHAWISPLAPVYTFAFFVFLSFALTQTSMIYSMHTMACEEYYSTHPRPASLLQLPTLLAGDGGAVGGGEDICDVPWIQSEYARQVGLNAVISTIGSIINNFWTAYLQRKIGLKAAMYQQSIWTGVRTFLQLYALHVGGRAGIHWAQLSLAINSLGSIGGVQLVGNSYIGELSSAEARTANFGRFSGIWQAAGAVGFISGGILYDRWWPALPWEVASVFVVGATIFGMIALPFIPLPGAEPETESPSSAPSNAATAVTGSAGSAGTTGEEGEGAGNKKKSQQHGGVLEPLKAILPTRVPADNGSTRLDFNVTLLGAGEFLSTLATGYVPLGLQMLGTDVFGFTPLRGGFMQSLALLVKALFLTFMFPYIISTGRKLLSARSPPPLQDSDDPDPPSSGTTPSSEPGQKPSAPISTLFDLYFLRYSIFIDALITSLVSFASQPWHLFLAAGVIPLASGTGPACRGVVLDLVPPRRKTETLAGIALMERLGIVCMSGIFSMIFSALTEAGVPTYVFIVNGATALVAFFVLFLVRMPKKGRIRD